MKKLQLQAIFLAFLSFAIFSCAPNRNPYNLDITATMEEYRAQVEANPLTELVDLEEVIPGIVLDIRYATKNNFTGVPIYTSPKAFLCRPAAEALRDVQAYLKLNGLGLKIYDAYRPYAGTLYFFEVCQDTNFVANPAKGSIHNRGCAVDLSLINLSTGEELEMPTGFDEFVPQAYQNAMEGVSREAVVNRAILRGAMERHGFKINPTEWWHYNLGTSLNYPLRDISFEQLMGESE